MNISEKINYLMKEHNIKSPRDLANALENKNLKIPYTTLLTIINNEVKDIKLGTAEKLCTFFNITLDDLLNNNISVVNKYKLTLNIKGLTDADIKELKQIIEIKRKNNKENKKE